MRFPSRFVLCAGLAAAALVSPRAVGAGAMDTASVWPLCGRIAENPPAGWLPEDGCPLARAGDPAYSDAPFSSTFGPRPLASESNRYDFHRGVDLATPIGTPLFAITSGVVQHAGVHPDYDDPVIRIRHYRPGFTSCSTVGCYESQYLHVSGWEVAAGQSVTKGQLIGWSGASGASGFEHLHFELRDAPAFDPSSAWSRDAVHPFRVLPYAAPNSTSISWNAVDPSDPQATRADLTVSSNRYDLVAVELLVRDADAVPIAQPGDVANAHGYHVLPASFDYERTNFEYSHKNSTSVPWSSFQPGGVNECPYWSEHGASYSASVHLDEQDPLDSHVGLFNGVRTRTAKYWPSDQHAYEVRLEFLELVGPAACVEATARFASGATTTSKWGACAPPPPPPAITLAAKATAKRNQIQLTWSGATGAKVDLWRNGALYLSTPNDGSQNDRNVARGATYRYRLCEKGSTAICSAEVPVTL